MGIAAQQLKFDEWCPSCGEGVDYLHPLTGFCLDCSPIQIGQDKIPCESCGNDFIPYQSSRKTCKRCELNKWLERNANAIERVMVHHAVKASKAILIVSDDNRPRCAMCGDKIKHGTKGKSIFCKKRDECRRAQIRYRNYRRRNNMSDDDALEKAINGKR